MQFRRRDSLAKIYELNIRFVDALAKEMEESRRYPKDTVLRDVGYVLIEEGAFRDYLQNRRLLKDPIARRYVPIYTREKAKGEPVYIH